MKRRIKVVLADNPALLEAVYAIRLKVFVEEQQIKREDEFDARDAECRHFLAQDADTKIPLGSARWRKTGAGIKLERFCVLQEHRGCGAGSALVQAVLADIGDHYETPVSLYLHAQISALPLYRKFGFQAEEEEYMECGIPHRTMRLTLLDS